MTATKVEVDGQTIHLSQWNILCTENEASRWAVPQETRCEGQGVYRMDDSDNHIS